MPKFDTRVQQLRYTVLKEIIRHIDRHDLEASLYDIPKTVVPGPKPSMRCCIYKERAIVEERVEIATRHSIKDDENIIGEGVFASIEALADCFAKSFIDFSTELKDFSNSLSSAVIFISSVLSAIVSPQNKKSLVKYMTKD